MGHKETTPGKRLIKCHSLGLRDSDTKIVPRIRRDMITWGESGQSKAGLKMVSETGLNHQFSNVAVKISFN